MKKLLSLLSLSLALILVLIGCSPAQNPQGEPDDSEKEPEVELLPIEPLIQTLSCDVYAHGNEAYAGMYGLQNTAVGIDQDRFENEILYPFPDDSEFVQIINMAEKGFGESRTAADNLYIINQVLSSVQKAKGKVKIVFPSGTFKITQGIGIGGCKDLYLCSEGETKLVLDKYTSVFYIVNSENIHVTGFTGGYQDAAVIAGTIKAFNAETATVTVDVDKSFKMYSANYTEGGISGYYELTLNEEDGRYYYDLEKNARYVWGDTWNRTSKFGNTIEVHFANGYAHTPKVGDKVNLMMQQYGTNPFGINSCKNVYVENCKVTSSPGMVFISNWSENIYVNRLVIAPDIERGVYMTTCADGFHTVGLKGDLVLTNCTVDGTQDDCLNICMQYDNVSKAEGSVLTSAGNNTQLDVGHTIEIYDDATFELLGTYTVTAKSGLNFTLDKPIDSRVSQGDRIGNVSMATHLTIDNCLFANSYGRGGLIQTRDTVIKNSTYKNLSYCGLKIHSCGDEFKEGIVPRNVTVENCKFIDCNQMPYYDSAIEVLVYVMEGYATTPGTMKNIKILNNAVIGTAGNAVSLYGVGDSEVKNNLFYDIFNKDGYFSSASFLLSTGAVGARYTANVAVEGNCLYEQNAADWLAFLDADATCTDVTEKKNEYYLTVSHIDRTLYAGFSTELQGENGWSYRCVRNGNFKFMNYSAEKEAWNGGALNTMIAGSFVHPDSYDPAVTFTVPSAGKWEVVLSLRLPYPESDGVTYNVLHNDQSVLTGEQAENGIYIAPTTCSYQRITLDCQAGDTVTLTVNRYKTNSHDSTSVQFRMVQKTVAVQ